MNRVFLQNSLTEGNIFHLTDKLKVEHLLHHLKIVTGSEVKVAIEGKGLGTAIIRSCNEKEVFFEITEYSPAEKQPFVLMVASSRPPTMKKILEHGTSLGVGKFIFFTGELSEKSYLKSKIYDKESLKDLLTLGIEQAGIFSELPEVVLANSLKEALSHTLGMRILLSLSEEKKWTPETFKEEKNITLAIGPERGWTKKEEEILVENQFLPFKISASTLRVEIATFAALGQLEYLFKKNP